MKSWQRWAKCVASGLVWMPRALKLCEIAVFNPKGPFLSPISSCRPEKEHSIGKMKFCIGLSLVLKLLVRKRVWNSCFQPKRGFGPFFIPISSCRHVKEDSISKLKLCIWLSLVLKLLQTKECEIAVFKEPLLSPISSCRPVVRSNAAFC